MLIWSKWNDKNIILWISPRSHKFTCQKVPPGPSWSGAPDFKVIYLLPQFYFLYFYCDNNKKVPALSFDMKFSKNTWRNTYISSLYQIQLLMIVKLKPVDRYENRVDLLKFSLINILINPLSYICLSARRDFACMSVRFWLVFTISRFLFLS